MIAYSESIDSTKQAIANELGVVISEKRDEFDFPYIRLTTRGTALCLSPNEVLELPTNLVTRRARTADSALLRACDTQPGIAILDALSGWGIDGLTLASRGAEVTLYEQDSLVHLMQRDLARRSRIAVRSELGNVFESAKVADSEYQVVYLDPMFPPHPSRAKAKRRMEVLSQLVSDSPGVTELSEMVEWGLALAKSRVVLKLRRKQIVKELPKPSWSIPGRAVRFDVYWA